MNRKIDLEEIDTTWHVIAETGFRPHASTFTLRSVGTNTGSRRHVKYGS